MGWEDQGRQDHGWFGTGTSGNVPDIIARPATAACPVPQPCRGSGHDGGRGGRLAGDGPRAGQPGNPAGLADAGPHAAFIADFTTSKGDVAITVQIPGDFNIGSTVAPDKLAWIASLGIEVGVEVFPDMG